jgi:hypothetical protein
MPKRNLPPLPPLDANQRYSIEESIRYLRSSRKSFYQDIARGLIAVMREPGRKRTYVHGSELIRRSAPPPAT